MKRRKHLKKSTWDEIKTAYTSGVPLREIARKMGIPAGTILSRAKREGWRLEAAQAIVKADPKLQKDLLVKNDPESSLSVTEAVVLSLRERAEKYTSDMAGLTGERLLPHLRSLPVEELLEMADRIEKLDRVTRRSFGLDKDTPAMPSVNIGILGLSLNFRKDEEIPPAIDV